MAFDICPKLHVGSNFGWNVEKNTYSRPRASFAKCYAEEDNEKCTRKGKCIIKK